MVNTIERVVRNDYRHHYTCSNTTCIVMSVVGSTTSMEERLLQDFPGKCMLKNFYEN